MPGLKVLRWEREWDAEDRPFRNPREYPPCSVAISGTHDTESMADWWDGADLDERQAVAAIPDIRDAGVQADEPFSERVRDALLSALFHASSDFVLIALPDVFGWRDRINTPVRRQRRQLDVAIAVGGREADDGAARGGESRVSRYAVRTEVTEVETEFTNGGTE